MAIPRGQQLARRQGDASRRRSRGRDGWSDKRRERPRSRSREPKRPSPAVGDAHHESQAGQLGSRSVNGKRSTSRERFQDRQQAAVMNAANDSQGHDSAAAIHRLFGTDKKASEEGSDTPFAAATPSAHPPYDSHPMELELRTATASAGLRRRRPLENAAVFFVLLELPLSQRPCA